MHRITFKEMNNFIRNICFDQISHGNGIYEFSFSKDINIGISYESIEGEGVYIFNIFKSGEYINIPGHGTNEDPMPDGIIKELVAQYNKLIEKDDDNMDNDNKEVLIPLHTMVDKERFEEIVGAFHDIYHFFSSSDEWRYIRLDFDPMPVIMMIEEMFGNYYDVETRQIEEMFAEESIEDINTKEKMAEVLEDKYGMSTPFKAEDKIETLLLDMLHWFENTHSEKEAKDVSAKYNKIKTSGNGNKDGNVWMNIVDITQSLIDEMMNIKDPTQENPFNDGDGAKCAVYDGIHYSGYFVSRELALQYAIDEVVPVYLTRVTDKKNGEITIAEMSPLTSHKAKVMSENDELYKNRSYFVDEDDWRQYLAESVAGFVKETIMGMEA